LKTGPGETSILVGLNGKYSSHHHVKWLRKLSALKFKRENEVLKRPP
jgi:hypothetical protein